MDWILFALVKSKICELNLLRGEHDPVLVTLQSPRGKQAPQCFALRDSRAVSQHTYPLVWGKTSETQVETKRFYATQDMRGYRMLQRKEFHTILEGCAGRKSWAASPEVKVSLEPKTTSPGMTPPTIMDGALPS
ncbi:mCG61372 [Mus musculus]|nr:mCG61372 [Mus musculus]